MYGGWFGFVQQQVFQLAGQPWPHRQAHIRLAKPLPLVFGFFSSADAAAFFKALIRAVRHVVHQRGAAAQRIAQLQGQRPGFVVVAQPDRVLPAACGQYLLKVVVECGGVEFVVGAVQAQQGERATVLGVFRLFCADAW